MSILPVDSDDDARFRKALLYVAQKGSIDPEMGIVKIFKALIFADVLAMSSIGHTITRWKYLNFDKGPIPCNSHEILADMAKSGQVQELSVPLGRYHLKRIVVLQPVDPTEFTPTEQSLLDMGLGMVVHRSASSASEMSHKLPLWRWSEKDKLIDEGLLKYPFLISEVKLLGSRLKQALDSAREQGLV